jgi:hypothetical protein
MNPLDDAVLKEALEDFLRQPTTLDRIKWWLLFAHSNERWVQFEYGYHLNERLSSQYVVGCERKYVDLAIYRRQETKLPYRRNLPAAKIELKVQGNWYTKEDNFKGVNYDANKIRGETDCPAMALVLWFYAVPTDANRECQWISQQVASDVKCGLAVDAPQKMLQLLRSKCDEAFFEIANLSFADSDFAELRVSLYGFRNELARQAGGDGQITLR